MTDDVSLTRALPTEIPPPRRAEIPPNQAALEAIAHTRAATIETLKACDRLLQIAQLGQTPPEFRTIVINPANNGQYVTLDQSRFECKSIGVINPTAVNVYLGVGGVSATPASRAPSVGPQSMLVLPVALTDLELGCDPTVLLGNTAVVYLLRFLTVQPLNVQLLT